MSTLNWDTSFAIAKALRLKHSSMVLSDVSLEMIYEWTLDLPEFEDDPSLATDEILAAIYQEWYEAVITELDKL
jgi:FeS assembly protein IscX